jgi:hypothetical protein
MSTLKQKLASRANGKKSRGPVTKAGKAISSRNSTRHGILSNTLVLDRESKERFQTLLQNLTNEHEPSTETERVLVETMAVSRWRQMRIWGIEKNILAAEITKLEAYQPCDDYATTVAAAFRSLADNSHSLQLIQRYDAYSFRSFLRCLKTLTELQEGIAPEPDSQPEIQKNQTNPIPDFPEQNQQPADPENQPESPAAASAPPVQIPLPPPAGTHSNPATQNQHVTSPLESLPQNPPSSSCVPTQAEPLNGRSPKLPSV